MLSQCVVSLRNSFPAPLPIHHPILSLSPLLSVTLAETAMLKALKYGRCTSVWYNNAEYGRVQVFLCVLALYRFPAPQRVPGDPWIPRLPEILDFCFFFASLFKRNSLIVHGNDTNNTFSFSELPSASKSETDVSETLTPIVFASTTFSSMLPLALALGQYLRSNMFSQEKPSLSATSDSMLLPATFGDDARVPRSVSSLSSENHACRVEREATSMSMIDGGDGSRHIPSFLQVSLLQIFIFTSP